MPLFICHLVRDLFLIRTSSPRAKDFMFGLLNRAIRFLPGLTVKGAAPAVGPRQPRA